MDTRKQQEKKLEELATAFRAVGGVDVLRVVRRKAAKETPHLDLSITIDLAAELLPQVTKIERARAKTAA